MAKMGRKPISDEARRTHKVATYLAGSELELYAVLIDQYRYQGNSDIGRKALACLVNVKHPELRKYLRDDLTSTG